MRIYSGAPQDARSNRCRFARVCAVDFFAVPLAAKQQKRGSPDRHGAPATAGARRPAIIAAGRLK